MEENTLTSIKEAVLARETELLDLIAQKQKALRGAGSDRLHASKHNRTVQFYRVHPDGPKEYLRNGSIWIQRLAQKEYDQRVLQAAEQEEKLLNRLAALYDRRMDYESQYERILPAKRTYVTPVREPDAEYVRKWLAQPYQGLDFTGESGWYYTDSGERMRSKSEMIIANLLRKNDIPYRYECPLILNNPEDYSTQTVYPDFTILRVRDRQEIYWEHLGMLENPDYLVKNLRKIRLYEMNGFFLGQKLIITFETGFAPLNMRLLEHMIEAYFS